MNANRSRLSNRSDFDVGAGSGTAADSTGSRLPRALRAQEPARQALVQLRAASIARLPLECEPFDRGKNLKSGLALFILFGADPSCHQSISNWRTKSSSRGKPLFSLCSSISLVSSSRLQAHSSQLSAAGPGSSGGAGCSRSPSTRRQPCREVRGAQGACARGDA